MSHVCANYNLIALLVCECSIVRPGGVKGESGEYQTFFGPRWLEYKPIPLIDYTLILSEYKDL